MSEIDDGQLEQLLRKYGEDWRSRTVPSRDVDASWFAAGSVERRPLRWIPSVAAVLLALAVVAVFALTELNPARPPGAQASFAASPTGTGFPVIGQATRVPIVTPSTYESATPSPDASALTPPTGASASDIVDIGDTVMGSGNIVQWDQGTHLCPGFDSFDGRPSCAFFISLPGFDARSVSGRELDGMWVTDFVAVVGTWNGEGVRVTQTAPAEPTTEPSMEELPCDRPADGWPGVWPDDAGPIRLSEAIARHQEIYVGPWDARIVDGTAVTTAKAVGTTGDPDDAYRDLRRVFAFNLCVTQVEFSGEDLTRAVDALSAPDAAWHVEVAPAIDRVIVKAAAYDSELAQAIGSYRDRVVVVTFVELVR